MSAGHTRTPDEGSTAVLDIADLAPKLAALTDEVVFGDIWERPGLSKRDRSLITISALIARDRTEQLTIHLRRALENGLSQDEIVEAITHLAFYAGWPSAFTAINLAKSVFTDAELAERSRDRDRSRSQRRSQRTKTSHRERHVHRTSQERCNDHPISGHVEEGWGHMADAFRANFDQHGELGAACAIYEKGKVVVDLWGGVADARTGRVWDEDTISIVFSQTKGITAILAHILVERGLLDLEAPVVQYWPEFGIKGKESTRVRWLLSHQAGLPWVDEALTLEELCSWDPVVRALEQQRPAWEPGTHHAYHTLTYGWLIGEVLRRITSKTPGTFFADDIAGPLGLRAWIGLPAAEQPNVAHVEPAPSLDGPIQEIIDGFVGPGTMAARTIEFGGALPLGLVTPGGGFNDPRVWAAEMPGGNLISDARSMARTYAATIGEVDGVRLLQPGTVAAATTVQTTSSAPFGIPPGLENYDIVKSLGFDAPTAMSPMLGPSSFGHGGAGGSMSFADRDRGIAFAYVMNQMLTEIPGPPRVALLVDALKTSINV